MQILHRFSKETIPKGRTPYAEALKMEYALCHFKGQYAGDGKFRPGGGPDSAGANVEAERLSVHFRNEAFTLVEKAILMPQYVDLSVG